jgi:hypothetical protein
MIHRFLNIASSKGPTYAEQWANEDAVKTVLLRVSELIALLKPGAVFQELELPLRSPELSMTRLQGQDLPREGAGLANYFPDVNPKLTRINALMAGMAQFATQVVNLHTLSQQAALHAQKLADLEAAARVAQQDGRPIDEKAELQSIRLQEQLELESLAAVMANTEGQRPGASLWLLYYTLLFRNLEAVALEATHPEGGRVADPRITGVSMRTEGVPDLVVALALEDHYDRYKTVPDPQELQNAIGRVLAKDGAYNRRVAKLRATLRPIAKGHAVTSERVAQLEEEAIALYRSLGLA